MKPLALCAVLLPALALGGFFAWPKNSKSSTARTSPLIKPASHAPAAPAAKPVAIDLQLAMDRGLIAGSFNGNGRERVRAVLASKTAAHILVKITAGQMLESATNSVIVLRGSELALTRQPAELLLETAALQSTNHFGEAPYHLAHGETPELAALLGYAAAHPRVSTAALQTAVLALTENLPLHTVAKFSPPSGRLPTRFDTAPFRVDTAEILRALTLLRELGVKDEALAMTIDPQLEIESMIDPQTHAAAMDYYGLTRETEWEYWKTELLSGEASTRHYALFGIARFYPDVAVEMLPKWAREEKTSAVFRLTAIEALAETHRAEALPALRQPTNELGRETEFGRAAASAARLLDSQLSKIAANEAALALGGSSAHAVSHF